MRTYKLPFLELEVGIKSEEVVGACIYNEMVTETTV